MKYGKKKHDNFKNYQKIINKCSLIFIWLKALEKNMGQFLHQFDHEIRKKNTTTLKTTKKIITKCSLIFIWLKALEKNMGQFLHQFDHEIRKKKKHDNFKNYQKNYN